MGLGPRTYFQGSLGFRDPGGDGGVHDCTDAWCCACMSRPEPSAHDPESCRAGVCAWRRHYGRPVSFLPIWGTHSKGGEPHADVMLPLLNLGADHEHPWSSLPVWAVPTRVRVPAPCVCRLGVM